MGRPPMNLEETKVRLNGDHKRRIVALVGENQMAAFIREAVEEALQRREARAPAPAPTRNRPPGAN
ncbi:hypothetical protein IAI61_21825 [Roseomonas sp. 573]|uniref:Uncharacterized protein n=2 Tax=Roseomonas haemaphysalidis TaxID=2768162 RepID=A0ABS3KXN1_9PROT|nr:hypothetical protein [Roseomonas haemaphysalidis]